MPGDCFKWPIKIEFGMSISCLEEMSKCDGVWPVRPRVSKMRGFYGLYFYNHCWTLMGNTIYCDNLRATCVQNQSFTPNEHIMINFCLVREKIAFDILQGYYVYTHDQFVGLLTKPFSKTHHNRLSLAQCLQWILRLVGAC